MRVKRERTVGHRQANDSQCYKGQTVSRTIYQRVFRRQLLWKSPESGRRDKALLSMVCKKGVFSRYFLNVPNKKSCFDYV